MKQNLSLITLGVTDLKRSQAFYRDVMGWKTSSTLEDGVLFFDMAGFILALFPRRELAKDAGIPEADGPVTGISLAHNVASPEEVDRIFDDLKAKGVTIIKSPQKAFWGGYTGYFSDPDGYLWEVAHNPFWSFDEKGRIVLPS